MGGGTIGLVGVTGEFQPSKRTNALGTYVVDPRCRRDH
jgi:hypothetical protein